MEKYIYFLIDFLPIINKDQYYNFGKVFIKNPKKIYSFIPHGYIFEYLYEYHIGNISEEELVYIGDIISNKRTYNFFYPKEDIKYIEYLIKNFGIKDCYILITKKAYDFFNIDNNILTNKNIDLFIFD